MIIHLPMNSISFSRPISIKDIGLLYKQSKECKVVEVVGEIRHRSTQVLWGKSPDTVAVSANCSGRGPPPCSHGRETTVEVEPGQTGCIVIVK